MSQSQQQQQQQQQQQILKRDNTHQCFDRHKICNAIRSSGVTQDAILDSITDAVVVAIQALGTDIVPLEDVQDTVEREMMAHGEFVAAKAYILYRLDRASRRTVHGYDVVNKDKKSAKMSDDEPVETPWGEIGYLTYKRTYSRVKNDSGESEEFEETVGRVLEACQKQLGVGFTEDELMRAYRHFKGLKCSVAGRFLWQLGTDTVSRLGLASLQNCAFCTIDHPIRPFTWIFDFLMLGSGCGFSIQREHVDKLPAVIDADITVERKDTNDADFIVPDSREGWVYFLERTLEAFFLKGRSFTYSTVLIRSAGKRINGFGGVASGPESLCEGIDHIATLLRKRRGQKLSTVDCLDIVNIIASVVVSGNVRRSALLAIGDADDIDYLMAKRWDLGNIPNWRAMSNNSVVASSMDDLPDEFWEGYHGNGEPYGLINLDLARSVGRLADGSKYPDPDVKGFNPCLTADTIVLTSDGPKPIGDLVGKPFEAIVDGKAHPSTDSGFVKTGTLPVKRVTLDNGLSVKATGNHRFLTEDGWVHVDDMVVGETKIILSESTVGDCVAQIEDLPEPVDVYDCTIPDVHRFSANGMVSHNCAEQALANFETCCLSEMFLPNIESYEEAVDVATILYRICKHSLALPCHASETGDIVHKNMRMGVGVTGYLQATEEQRSWLSRVYEHLRALDVSYSEAHGWPTSIKLTTCKPSGTLSLLAGVTPGVHPAIFPYFIRRVRISTSNALCQICRDHGYRTEFQRKFDGTDDQSTTVVEFPCRFPEGTVLAKDTSALQQLEHVKRLQTEWSDNSVSVTVYYRKSELPEIREWLARNYTTCVKTVSFLLHNDHGFAQAPYEEISKELYEEMKHNTRPLTGTSTVVLDDMDASAECAGGACPIK